MIQFTFTQGDKTKGVTPISATTRLAGDLRGGPEEIRQRRPNERGILFYGSPSKLDASWCDQISLPRDAAKTVSPSVIFIRRSIA